MKFISRIALTVLLAAASIPASANSLLDIYQQALTQDMTLNAALHARDAAVEARPQAWAAYLPQLNANANIQRQQQNYLSVSSVFLRAGQHYYNTNKSWTVSLSQAIWNFQDYEKLRESAVQVAQAENTYQTAQQSLIMSVAQAYFNVLSAQDTVRADIAARDAFQSQLKQARDRFHVGLATITDVQTAKASADSSYATLLTDRQALANARQALAVLTGDYRANIAPLRTRIPLRQPSPDEVGVWVKAALKDNLTLRGAQLQYQVAKRDISVQRAAYYPSVNLQGSVGESITGGQSGANTRDYAIGLQLSVPIFQGGLVHSRVRQAVATAAQYQSQYIGQQRTTEQQTRNAFEAVNSGITTVKAYRAAVESNRTALKAMEVGLRVGTENIVNVITAQQNLYTALKNYYQSRYNYLESVLTLKQQAGRLTVADLRRIDGLLAPTTGMPPPPVIPTQPGAVTGKTSTPSKSMFDHHPAD